MYVPIAILLKVAAIAELTDKADDIVDAVRASKKIVLDDLSSRVRPNHTVKRSTIILREVADGLKEADVRKLFDGLGEVEHCENEFGNIWFVRLTEEKAAKDAVFALQSKGQKARLKSESILRSYIGKVAPVRPAAGGKGPASGDKPGAVKNPYANGAGNPYMFGGLYGPGAQPGVLQPPTFRAGDGDAATNHIKYIAQLQQQEQMMRMQYLGMNAGVMGGLPPHLQNMDPNDPKVRRHLQRQFGGRSRGRGGGGNFPYQGYGPGGGRRDKGAGGGERSGKRSKKGDRKDGGAANAKKLTPNIDSPEFPPLNAGKAIDSKDFPHRYSSKDIVSIIKSFPKQLLTRPESMAQFANNGVVLDAPYEEMVNKQRSLSMDEVDKALRTGQTIRVDRAQSEDYSDLFYGNAAHRSGRRRGKARSQHVVDTAPGAAQSKTAGSGKASKAPGAKDGKGAKDAKAQAPAPAPVGAWAAALKNGAKNSSGTGKNSKKKQASREANAGAAAQSQKKQSQKKKNAPKASKSAETAAPAAATESPWAAAAKAKPSDKKKKASASGESQRKQPAKTQQRKKQAPESSGNSSTAATSQQPADTQTTESTAAAPAAAPATTAAPRPVRGWERPGTAPILPKPKPKPAPPSGDDESKRDDRDDDRKGRGRRRGDEGRRRGAGRRDGRNGRERGSPGRKEKRAPATSSGDSGKQAAAQTASAPVAATNTAASESATASSAPAPAPAPAPAAAAVTTWGGKTSFAAVLKKTTPKKASAGPPPATDASSAAKTLTFASAGAAKPAATEGDEPRVGRSDDNNWRRR